MAPSSGLSSQTPGKTQKSIASFFSQKPAPQGVLSQKRKASSQDIHGFGHGNGVFTSLRSQVVDDDADLEPVAKKARRLINGFQHNGQEQSDDTTIPKNDSLLQSPDAAPESLQAADQDLAALSTTSPDRSSPHRQHAAPPSSDRTSKYAFSNARGGLDEDRTDVENVNGEQEDEEQFRKQKQRLHEKFIKRLGHPDSMMNISRRNNVLDDETEANEEEGELDDEEREAPKAAKDKKPPGGKRVSKKLTPMERQIVDIKTQHMDTLLLVEVGYKYRLFGEDARIAARELQIFCIPGKYRFDEHPSEAHLDRFASASFPTHRLHVHVRRLVQAGHKVGVVRQLETAALKAVGDNRNTPFVRQLTNLYTKGTYIDDLVGIEGKEEPTANSTLASGHLLCITETNASGWGTDEKVQIGFIAVQPTTGDIIYDDFEDGFMRSELETRLLHISPCEFVIVGDTSKATAKIIAHLAASRSGRRADEARIEYVEKPKTMAAQAYSHISTFYAERIKEGIAGGQDLLEKVHQLTELVTICLSSSIHHLTAYGLQHVFDLTKYFQTFSARSHMLINGNTLTSLEIYQNQTDYTATGSLLWTLDKTQTRFGQRLLRKWVGRPLLHRESLVERIEAVTELMSGGNTSSTDRLRRTLRGIKGDLEKSLIRIYYKKCTRSEVLTVLQTLQAVANEWVTVSDPASSGYESPLLGGMIASLPVILDDVVSYLEKINLGAAKEDDKYNFFRQEHESDEISGHKVEIVSVEFDLEEQKKTIAEKLHKKRVDFVTNAGIEYLVEVDNDKLKHVPASWPKISGTKKVSRFHTPEVIKLIRQRDQSKEALANECDLAFNRMLTDLGVHYQSFRDCVQSLATLDCLLSLAEVSSLPGYCKPEFVTGETRIEIEGGRHAMVEQILLDTYVPNDIDLSSDGTRALLVTGPNMGGKSSYVRSVALICVMAQIGCYVPATSARLSLLDGIYTRMGAFDNMMKGESTFMVELSETSDILKQATPRSLVILDELGRGTSTHDGVAIAQAVLDYMLRTSKSLTLFITHYQTLARMADQWPGELKNVHMRFTETATRSAETEITFLYQVGEGTAHRSYGLNVARLAGLPKSLVEQAGTKSKELEVEELRRRLAYLAAMMPKTLTEGGVVDEMAAAIEQLG